MILFVKISCHKVAENNISDSGLNPFRALGSQFLQVKMIF